MRTAPLAILTAIFTLTAAAAFSQSRAGSTAVTAISKADIEAVLKHTGKEGAGTDRQIRVVDMGKYNVGVGVLHRGATKPGAPVISIAHTQVTEVYYVISGAGTLITGTAVRGAKPIPNDSEIVTIAVGPSLTGVLENAEQRKLAVGDVVVIPAGVYHGFIDVTDHVTYLSVRPDADHVLPAGYVHPAIKK
jgi:mannose-6-phosphate isomerase-like protein (cupin superfamily)